MLIWYHALSSHWHENVDVYQVMRDAFDIDLSKNLRLPAYVELALLDDQILHEIRRALPAEAQGGWSSVGELPSYLGTSWGIPILCSMMIGWAESDAEAQHWNDELLLWQESAAYMPMITASFGLSRDYDQFLIQVQLHLWYYVAR